MTTSPVVIENLGKSFYDSVRGEVRAVDSVSLECQRGEILGLLGANGAGKTTTLRILATILTPTSGEAWVEGYSVTDESEEARRNLGFYSGTTALYPRLTAREVLELFARLNDYPEEEVASRCDFLIDRFAIEDYADVLIDKLSTGMKQKVSVARTIAHDPPVLIFDEPTVGLDVLNARELQNIIAELRAHDKTILFSTHIMAEAERLCDRIAIIHEGQVRACGSLEELRVQTGHHYLEDIFVHLVAPERSRSPT